MTVNHHCIHGWSSQAKNECGLGGHRQTDGLVIRSKVPDGVKYPLYVQRDSNDLLIQIQGLHPLSREAAAYPKFNDWDIIKTNCERSGQLQEIPEVG